MWTVCWSDENGDHWDRLENLEEVRALCESEGLIDDDDTMIFPPETDDLWNTPLYLFG